MCVAVLEACLGRYNLKNPLLGVGQDLSVAQPALVIEELKTAAESL